MFAAGIGKASDFLPETAKIERLFFRQIKKFSVEAGKKGSNEPILRCSG